LGERGLGQGHADRLESAARFVVVGASPLSFGGTVLSGVAPAF
jgi:hypothetical protein